MPNPDFEAVWLFVISAGLFFLWVPVGSVPWVVWIICVTTAWRLWQLRSDVPVAPVVSP